MSQPASQTGRHTRTHQHTVANSVSHRCCRFILNSSNYTNLSTVTKTMWRSRALCNFHPPLHSPLISICLLTTLSLCKQAEAALLSTSYLSCDTINVNGSLNRLLRFDWETKKAVIWELTNEAVFFVCFFNLLKS